MIQQSGYTKETVRGRACIYFFNVPITESGAYLGITFGSCNMLNSSVASRPAYNSLQDRLLSSGPGVVRKELHHVEHLSVDDHPDVVFLVVLRDFLGGEFLCASAWG